MIDRSSIFTWAKNIHFIDNSLLLQIPNPNSAMNLEDVLKKRHAMIFKIDAIA